jgi:uncharacterized protein
MSIAFEWDDEKAARNIRDHDGVTFEQAASAFNDTFAVEWIDEREDYGEERSVLLGMTGGQILYVAYTERSNCLDCQGGLVYFFSFGPPGVARASDVSAWR